MREPADAHLDELKRKARRRLVGAVVLALAAAVFVPMLLESDERPLGDDVSVRIPPVDQGKFVNRLSSPPPDIGKPADPADAAAAKAGEAVAGAKDAVDAGNGQAPATSATNVEPRASGASGASANAGARAAAPAEHAPPAGTKAAPAAPKAAPTAAAEKPAPGGFVVQLAAFSDDKGANALANRLKRGGHPAFTEPVKTSTRTLWRVRVGPYTSRDDANAARDKLKHDGQNGIVVPRSS